MTSIGGQTFWGCSSLTSVIIPESVTSIGYGAFSGCSLASVISIPEGVTTIGDGAFSGCRSLSSLTIPNSVTSIGNYAFSGCFFLSYKIVNNSALTSNSNWGATLCDEETSDGLMIANHTVVACRRWATSVAIPNGVTSIGNAAFGYCNSLTLVIIPNSVTYISEYAFYYCPSLTDVYCFAEEVPKTNSYSFFNTPVRSATLHVPASALEAYQTWIRFGSIVPLTDDEIDAVEDVQAAGVAAEADRYDLQGYRTTAPRRGISIVRMSDGTVRKVLVK